MFDTIDNWVSNGGFSFFSLFFFRFYQSRQHFLARLPRTPPWKKKFQVQELQLTFYNLQNSDIRTLLPSENLYLFEYFILILNFWVGNSQLILMKDILEAFDDKLIDFISFIEDFRKR
jgi:hypothetical protein